MWSLHFPTPLKLTHSFILKVRMPKHVQKAGAHSLHDLGPPFNLYHHKSPNSAGYNSGCLWWAWEPLGLCCITSLSSSLRTSCLWLTKYHQWRTPCHLPPKIVFKYAYFSGTTWTLWKMSYFFQFILNGLYAGSAVIWRKLWVQLTHDYIEGAPSNKLLRSRMYWSQRQWCLGWALKHNSGPLK